MTNKEVAEILDETGTLLELKGENSFKCRAYHNVARIVGALTSDINTLAKEKQLTSIAGIGKGLAETINELVASGRSTEHEKLRSSVPQGLLEMLRIPGLGPKRVRIIFEKLNISTLEELKLAAEQHRMAAMDGFGKKTEENLLMGIEQLHRYADKFHYPIARKSADRLLATLSKEKGVIRCEVAGSLRRRKEVVGDIDILVSAGKANVHRIMKVFTTHAEVESVVAQGPTKSSVVLTSGIRCDLRVVDDSEYPFALAYFTGSKEHNVGMRTRAKTFGWSMNEYGFSRIGDGSKRGTSKRLVKCASEEDVYRALELAFIPPELREDMGELDASVRSGLPRLIEAKDIRGTFHCHTTYSDGSNTVEEMARAARDRGWSYLGIADHSKVATYAGGLTEARVKAQHKEIESLNSLDSSFRIFKGTEVDILADGSLDWSEKVLASFDFVVASIHSKFKMTEAEATKRLIKALKNRHVTMLGHPTGRLLLQREGYPVNMKDVINAAADYGKVIEINSHPNRLDLDWRHCKYAKEQEVLISINPDAHLTTGLDDVSYGVGIARKGWLEASNVLNTMTLEKVSKYLYSH